MSSGPLPRRGRGRSNARSVGEQIAIDIELRGNEREAAELALAIGGRCARAYLAQRKIPNHHHPDIVSAATIAAWAAVCAWDPDRGVPLAAFVTMKANFACKDEARAVDQMTRSGRRRLAATGEIEASARRPLSLQTETSSSDDAFAGVIDASTWQDRIHLVTGGAFTAADPADLVGQREFRALLFEALDVVLAEIGARSDWHVEAFWRWIDGETQTSIGRHFGVSGSRVSQVIAEIAARVGDDLGARQSKRNGRTMLRLIPVERAAA